MKPTILVLMGGYWPGHDATGPNQSLRGLCAALAQDFCFKIVARDRPFGAAGASAPSGQWIEKGSAEIRYCPVGLSGPQGLGRILREMPHDILALNGFFDREFTIPALLLRRLGRIPRAPCVLSTRGEMAQGALGLKAPRKIVYRALSRRLGLLSDVFLHATGAAEAEDIRAHFPWCKGILVAPVIRELIDPPAATGAQRDSNGARRLVFVGRVARVKNLNFAIETLARVSARIDLDIYGPISEPDYWAECERSIAALPPNIRVRYAGVIANAEIPDAIGSADLFYLPTLGENFGHAIFEALSCGVPVLISDRTPWQGLAAKQAGFDLPLSQPEAFSEAIEAVAAMTAEERIRLGRGARALAESSAANSRAADQNRRLFATLLGGAATPAERQPCLGKAAGAGTALIGGAPQ